MEHQDSFFHFDHEKSSNEPISGANPPHNSFTEQRNTLVSESDRPHSSDMARQQEFEQAQEEFDAVVKNNKEIDHRLKENLMRHQTLITKLFPGKMQRLLNEKDRLLMGEALDFRVRLLKMGNQVRLEAMRDKYDCYLKAYKGYNRLMLTEIMIKQLTQLQRTVGQYEMQGFNELVLMYRNAETIPIQSLREGYVKQILQREVRFMEMISKTMGRFESLINEDLPQF